MLRRVEELKDLIRSYSQGLGQIYEPDRHGLQEINWFHWGGGNYSLQKAWKAILNMGSLECPPALWMKGMKKNMCRSE